MFSFLKHQTKNAVSKISTRALMLKMEALFVSLGVEVVEKDVDAGFLVFQLDSKSAALLLLNVDYDNHYIESNIIFDVEVGTLKLMSDVADVAFEHQCAITGMRGLLEDKAQVGIRYKLENPITRKNLGTAVSNFRECLTSLTTIVQSKLDSFNSTMLDISMFEHLDVSMLNPRLMGERKEFVYHTWERYAQAMAELGSEFETLSNLEASVPEIMACREFEEKNKVSLAEVGDIVARELKLHRHFMDTAEYVN